MFSFHGTCITGVKTSFSFVLLADSMVPSKQAAHCCRNVPEGILQCRILSGKQHKGSWDGLSCQKRMWRASYTVILDGAKNMPSCSCPAFRASFMLCKHFFALLWTGKAAWGVISERESLYVQGLISVRYQNRSD